MGSEMCIRDSNITMVGRIATLSTALAVAAIPANAQGQWAGPGGRGHGGGWGYPGGWGSGWKNPSNNPGNSGNGGQSGIAINVNPSTKYQSFDGIGVSEAFQRGLVIHELNPASQAQVLDYL